MFSTYEQRSGGTYFISANMERTMHADRRNAFDKVYGKECKVNDIIHIHLDLNKLYVSFGVNNNEYGKAFDIKKGEYRVGASTSEQGMQLELIKYECCTDSNDIYLTAHEKTVAVDD